MILLESPKHRQPFERELVERVDSPPPVDDVVDAVFGWLDDTRTRCLSRTIVPGASRSERARLAALGGLVRGVLGGNSHSVPPGVRAWIEGAPSCPTDVLEAATVALRTRGADFLAKLYERLVHAPNRRALGTFFTPQETVKWMLREWSEHEGAPACVVDVGAGVGAFTAATLATWKPKHLYAIDVNPVTLGLLGALSVALKAQPQSVHMVLEDYTAWKPPASMPGACVTVGNPPYTRLQLLPTAQRKRLQAEIDFCGKRAGLSTWILATALSRLRPQDGLVFLLPRNWMEADYGAGVRAKLWAARERRVELTCLSGDLFGDVRVDAVAMFVGPRKSVAQPFVLRRDAGDSGTSHNDRGGTPPSFVSPARSARFAGSTVAATATPSVQLASLARIRRGVATGDNTFFALSEESVRSRQLPRKALCPLVRRLRDHGRDTILCSDLDALASARWLLVVDEVDVKRSRRLQSYIAHGEELGVNRRHLSGQRKPWYALASDVTRPDVIVGAMSTGRRGFRFIENRAAAAITNNLFGVTWLPFVSAATRASVLSWLRSEDGQRAVSEVCRSQAGGLRKLEPRALASLPIPRAVVID